MLHNRFLTYLLIAIFAISAVFTACKPDDDDENGNEKVQLVKTATFFYSNDNDISLTCEYDNQNRITTALSRDNYKMWSYQFIYSENDLVKVIVFDKFHGYLYLNCSKNGNEITVGTDSTQSITIELNSDGYPIMNGYDYFQYLNGNLMSISNPRGITTYKYDNKKSPFYYCKTPKWFSIYPEDNYDYLFGLNNNNFTEEVRKRIDSSGEYTTTRTFTYEYDNNDFPTKMYQDGKLIATFTY